MNNNDTYTRKRNSSTLWTSSKKQKKRRRKGFLSSLRKRLRENAGNKTAQREVLKTISTHFSENNAEICDLNSTNLTCWYDYFLNDSNGVVKLILSRNQLNSLGKIFGNVQQNLQILEINDNNLKSFPDSIQFMKCLTELVAQRNQIDSLPTHFSAMKSLVSLNLSENKLSSLKHLEGLNHLQKLVVKNNQISHIDKDVISSWTSLRHLELDGNLLTEISSSIEALAKTLIVLCVSHNAIRALPSTIGSLTSLKRLNLRFNSIECIPASISKCTNLTKLLLHGNESTLKEPPFSVCVNGVKNVALWYENNK